MKAKQNFIVDVIALIIYLVAANPGITGLALHEWLSLGVFVVFFVHTLFHYDWIVDVLRKINRSSSLGTTGNLVLDSITLVVFLALIVSGLLISSYVLSSFNLFATGYFLWNPIHSIAAKLLLALLIIHIFAHWKWFITFFGRKLSENK